MKSKLSKVVASLTTLVLSAASLSAADRQNLPTVVPASAKAKRVGALPGGNRLQLAIGLPLHHTSFHDVTVGKNIEPFAGNGAPSSGGLYTAGPGYDNFTGLGTPNGASLMFALVNLGVTYMNFNYTGSTQNGTYFEPYKTLAAATNAVVTGGTIIIETAGSSSETMNTKKAMNITALDGAATIGN